MGDGRGGRKRARTTQHHHCLQQQGTAAAALPRTTPQWRRIALTPPPAPTCFAAGRRGIDLSAGIARGAVRAAGLACTPIARCAIIAAMVGVWVAALRMTQAELGSRLQAKPTK